MTVLTLNASRKTKKTAIGDLPVDWELRSGEHIASLITKGESPGWQGFQYVDEGVLFVTSENVRDGFLDVSSPKFITREFHEKLRRSKLHDNDILINLVGASIGRSCLFLGVDGEANINQAVALLRPREGVLPYWLMSYMQLPLAIKRLLSEQVDSARANISLENLREFIFPIPPLQEQQRIAAVLGTWDRAIARQEQLLAAKQQLKQSLMQQLLTGRKRFPELKAQKWQKVRLSDVLKQVTRRNTIDCDVILTGSANHGLIDQQEFYDRRVASEDTSGYYLVKRGEFAYNRSSANGYPFGATKRLDEYEMGVLSTLYLVFGIADEQRLNSDYALHLFESPYFNHQLSRLCREGARSHGLLNITASEFFSMHAMLPSPLEQKQIVSMLNAGERELALIERELAALRDQKRGLMQKLLTGKVRVKAS